MRIISGKYKGRKLMPPKDDNIRPTTDRIKETIFNVIQFKIQESRVLDLFSGTGALGIEALSRGADEVIFVDNNYASIQLINTNIERFEGDVSVLRCDFKDALSRQTKPFDLIFIDAPFEAITGNEAVKMVLEKNLLNRGGTIIFEHATKTPLSIEIPCDIIVKNKEMGSVTVDFLERQYEESGNGNGDI